MIRSRRVLRLLSGLLLTSVLLTSCGSYEGPTAPAAPAVAAPQSNLSLGPLLGGVTGLLLCNPQAPAHGQALIGPGGGILVVGQHRLMVPAGALLRPTLISGDAPSDRFSSVTFEPEGLQFRRTASLTLDYSNCPLGRINILKRVAYTDDLLHILSFLQSHDDLIHMRVTGDLSHFSRYAVAW